MGPRSGFVIVLMLHGCGGRTGADEAVDPPREADAGFDCPSLFTAHPVPPDELIACACSRCIRQLQACFEADRCTRHCTATQPPDCRTSAETREADQCIRDACAGLP